MPQVTLTHNVETGKEKDTALCLELSKYLSTFSGKPEKFINIMVNGGAVMSFNGSMEPAAHLRVCSIGQFQTLEQND